MMELKQKISQDKKKGEGEIEEEDEGIEEVVAAEKSKRHGFRIEHLANKLRALVALAILLGVLYIIVYNMFVPHSEKKEIPQEVIQTLLKLAAGGGQFAPLTSGGQFAPLQFAPKQLNSTIGA